MAIDHTRFIEVEYADAAESQVRFKLGDAQGGITVGYDSAHFSLPALRWAEVLRIAKDCPDAKSRCQSLLLLFPGTYLNEGEEAAAIRELEFCLTQLQLFERHDRPQLAENVVANRRMNCSWQHDPRLGWLCDSLSAQRNPKSLLSNLREEEFIRIKRFLPDEAEA